MKNYFLGFLFAVVFFLIGIITISQYGLNIDEPAHFIRGQAYLNLLLTGKSEYAKKALDGPRVSDWKIQQYNADYYLKYDSGHPAMNDILAAVTNRIFYEKLGILGDLESYHLFEFFISSLLVFLVFLATRRKFGVFAGIIATLSLFLYPLFLGESNFNIKDPIETTFFAATIYFFYLGIEKKLVKFFYLSAIFCALAFGTKFNIVFLPFIILPYLFFRFPPKKYLKIESFKKIPKSIYVALLLYPVIVFGSHIIFRPYLWIDPLGRFMEIVQYYQIVGTGFSYQNDFLFNGWNLYPPFFIAISTPPWILFLSMVGVFVAIPRIKKENDKFLLLLLLWLIVPILRVMWPGSSIYSGVRQIMEYLPALSIFAGVGGLWLRDEISKHIPSKAIVSLLIIAGFLPIAIKVVQLHPNQNVYMNFLIGGLPGAVEKKIPGAAETLGNVYLQGIWWFNDNAEKGDGFKSPVGLSSNFPRQFIREDLKIVNYFSGMQRRGEYMMEMISVDYPPRVYNFLYLDRFLEPVHEIKVDGVTLLKIWKNDVEHTKKGYLYEKEEKGFQISEDRKKGLVVITLKEPSYLTRLEIEHETSGCTKDISGKIDYSLDNYNFEQAPDELVNSQGTYAHSIQKEGFFVYFFPASAAKIIQLTLDDPNSCPLFYKNITVKSLRDIRP